MTELLSALTFAAAALLYRCASALFYPDVAAPTRPLQASSGDALGLLVSPLGLAFLLGTYFLGKPAPEPRLSPVFITLHVLANLLGVALFLLAGGAAALYLVQERRIKEKRRTSRIGNLPPLDT